MEIFRWVTYEMLRWVTYEMLMWVTNGDVEVGHIWRC